MKKQNDRDSITDLEHDYEDVYTDVKKMPLGVVFAVLLFVVMVVGIAYVWLKKFSPSTEVMSLDTYFDVEDDRDVALIHDGAYVEKDNAPYLIYRDDHIYISLSYLKNKIDDRYYYDKGAGLIRYTTTSEITTATESTTYTKGDETIDLDYAPLYIEDGAWVALDFVCKYSDISYEYYTDPKRVAIFTGGSQWEAYTLKKDTELRRHGGVKSPILEKGSKGEKVYLLEDYGDWMYVLSENGVLGCVLTKKVEAADTKTVMTDILPMQHHHILYDEPISMMWNQVTTSAANGDVAGFFSDAHALNVVSPTWYYLDSDYGDIVDISSGRYVDWCHEQGYKVWGLFSNVENTEVSTTEVLNSTVAREYMIEQVVSSAVFCGMDGINLDFEEVQLEAAEGYIELVRELSLACHENGLVLSVDNYVPTYSRHYNRPEQALYADYLVIMGYDETTGLEAAGPNASLDFVEQGVRDTLESAPANQVVLGMPMYGKFWALEDGELTMQNISMDLMTEIKEAHPDDIKWIPEDGQYYANYTNGNRECTIWIEDEESLALKFDLINAYGLAGAAYWKQGLHNSVVYDLAEEKLFN